MINAKQSDEEHVSCALMLSRLERIMTVFHSFSIFESVLPDIQRQRNGIPWLLYT